MSAISGATPSIPTPLPKGTIPAHMEQAPGFAAVATSPWNIGVSAHILSSKKPYDKETKVIAVLRLIQGLIGYGYAIINLSNIIGAIIAGGFTAAALVTPWGLLAVGFIIIALEIGIQSYLCHNHRKFTNHPLFKLADILLKDPKTLHKNEIQILEDNLAEFIRQKRKDVYDKTSNKRKIRQIHNRIKESLFPLENFQKAYDPQGTYEDLAEYRFNQNETGYRESLATISLQYFLLDFKEKYVPTYDNSNDSFKKEIFLRRRWIAGPQKELADALLNFNESKDYDFTSMQTFLKEMITVQKQSLALQTVCSIFGCLLSIVQSIVGFFTGPIEILGTICLVISIALGLSSTIATKALGAKKAEDLKKRKLLPLPPTPPSLSYTQPSQLPSSLNEPDLSEE